MLSESESDDSNIFVSESNKPSVLGLDIENQLDKFGNAESRTATNDFHAGFHERESTPGSVLIHSEEESATGFDKKRYMRTGNHQHVS